MAWCGWMWRSVADARVAILLDVFLASAVTYQSWIFPPKHLEDTTAGDKVSHGVYEHTFAAKCEGCH